MSKSKDNLVIIDADSMIYVIGYELADMRLEPLGIIKLDEFIRDILITTTSKAYIGYFGGSGGRNFRKDVAVTKKYKGNRAEDKPEWFEYWQPILKERMETHWGFVPCLNIEADDACAIARKSLEGKYNKITIASPDKDLFQIADTWFYDYTKRTTIYCDATTALHKLCGQIVKGDSGDNIPGCFGAGKAAADKAVEEIAEKGLDFDEAMEYLRTFYVNWHTKVLRDKEGKKQEKAFLIKYKVDNGFARYTKTSKSDALKEFKVDTSMLLSSAESIILFKEQYILLKLIDDEEEAKKHGFSMTEPIIEGTINWGEIDIFHEELEMMTDEEDFDEDLDEIL